MEFKFDTKSAYTHIIPTAEILNANMAGGLRQKWAELTESGSQNFIIDLIGCKQVEKEAFPVLFQWHEESYENARSLIFTNISGPLLQEFKKNDIDLILNITPTMEEAIDMVSMETLERDLFNEE